MWTWRLRRLQLREEEKRVSALRLMFTFHEAPRPYRSIHVLPNQWQFAFLFPWRPQLQGPRVST